MEDLHVFVQATHAIIEDLELRPAPPTPATAADAVSQAGAAPSAVVRILGCPARDEADELALVLFRQRLDPTRYGLEVVSAEALTAEVLTLMEQHSAELICIAALPRHGVYFRGGDLEAWIGDAIIRRTKARDRVHFEPPDTDAQL